MNKFLKNLLRKNLNCDTIILLNKINTRVWRNWQFRCDCCLWQKKGAKERRRGRKIGNKAEIFRAPQESREKKLIFRIVRLQILADTKFYQQLNIYKYAGVAELADALDLGSSVSHVQVQVLSPAPKNPSLRTWIFICYMM